MNVLIHYFVSAMFDQELSDKSKVQWIDFIVHSNNILFALPLESKLHEKNQMFKLGFVGLYFEQVILKEETFWIFSKVDF